MKNNLIISTNLLNFLNMKTSIFSKMNFVKTSFIALSGLVLLSCSEDNDSPEMVNEEEVITSVVVTLNNGGNTVTLSSVDLDGDGPNPPVVSVENLKANTTYTGAVSFLNEAESPVEDITEEVLEEADEHQVFYEFSGAITAATATDSDANGNPIGVAFTLTTGDTGAAVVGFTLRHEPKKPNSGLLDAGGETDVAVSFNVSVTD